MSAPSDTAAQPTSPATARVAVPDIIHELVERFERNRSQYRTPTYNETQVRREFLDPFFEALGWDVNNRQGYAEAYKDVVHEDAIRIAGKHKAPDYSFRVGGTRKFFVEAKKPSVDLARDPQPALQVRRYAWSAKLPLSILTDFEELAVYDCRIPPEAGDRASTARTMLIPFQEYPARWGDIYGRFSRDAVLKGSFDQYTDSAARKRGTDHVDAVFLRDLRSWREILAHNIALRNPGITVRELNFAVQQILDRIVFLRIAEDRQIEDYGKLRRAASGKDSYRQIVQLFRKAEDKYNSGLFHFKQEKGRTSQVDEITLGLKVDDRVLRDIVKHLYYPDSPYEFSVVSADILGQVYEQFLGQVIRLTPGGRAEVEDKPAVRKAGGVFYTPTFIVAYIVLRTVGRLLEGKTPKQVSSLRFVDPACGSGSFLIAVYEYLLNWHLAFYISDSPEKHARGRPPRVYQASGGEWRLTTDEKRRILLNNVFGVDIDPQAVEVTKLSLVLKVLEGETEESLGSQLALFQERVLPDLGNNIKCGNSLIDPRDFYAGHQPALLEEETLYRVNPFDWKAEFPQVFSGYDPGFDVVLGNPPYIRIQTMTEWAPLEVEFYKRRYATASKGNYDIYVVFVERGLELLNSHGVLGYILPHKFFNAQYGESLRRIIAEGKHLSEVVYFGHQQVFAQATTYTALLFLDKQAAKNMTYQSVIDLQAWARDWQSARVEISTDRLTSAPWSFSIGSSSDLVDRMSEYDTTLGDVADRIFQGVITGADTIFLFKAYEPGDETIRLYSAEQSEWIELESTILKPVVRSGDIRPFQMSPSVLTLFPYQLDGLTARPFTEIELQQQFPLAWSYLSRHRQKLENRERGKFRDSIWYRYSRTQNLGLWEQPKVMVPYMIARLASCLDQDQGYYFVNVTTGGYGITTKGSIDDLMVLCGQLNSRLHDFILRRISTTFRGGYFAANKQFIERLPIALPSSNDSRRRQLIELTSMLLAENRQPARERSAHDSRLQQRRLGAIEEHLNQLIFEMFELTDKEIDVVTSDGIQYATVSLENA